MRPIIARRWHVVLPVVVLLVSIAACTAAPSGGGSPTSSPPPTPGQVLVPTDSDVAYAHALPTELLDLYLPPWHGRPAPLLIWIHGGGWRAGSKSAIATVPDLTSPLPPRTDCRQIVQVQVPDVVTYNARGYAVAAIDYRIDEDAVGAVKDAKAAVRFLRANAARYHLDPTRFAVWGDSAGGYSAIVLALTANQHTVFDSPELGDPGVSDAVQAVVDWYGAADLMDVPGNLGPAYSPFTYISPGKSVPPFLIAQGSTDCVVSLSHSQHLYDALRAAGVTATLHVLPGAGHEDPAFMRTQSGPTFAFLNRTLHQ